MKYDSKKHKRKSIRLKEYDYSRPGWYFITICSYNHELLFSRIKDGEIILNDSGIVLNKCWINIPGHFPNAKLDEYVIMPNHIHGIIVINNVGAKNFSPLLHNGYENKFQSPSQTIGSIIRGFKIGVTKWFRKNTKIHNIWQRNYYEHIIRNEEDLNRIRNYIIENP